MTINPSSHAVLISTTDSYTDPKGLKQNSYEERVLKPGDDPFIAYSTTTRTIAVVDLEENDPRAK